MPVDVTIRKAAQAKERGDKHRALEILRSSLGNYGYSIELLQAYGDILHSNGNLIQAGAFYFASCRDPNDAQLLCLNKFIESHHDRNISHLIYDLPKVARLERLAMYPDFVQDRLKSLGASQDTLPTITTHKSDRMAVAGCIALVCIIVFLSIVGLLTIFKWLLS